jgi:hypothetical protein
MRAVQCDTVTRIVRPVVSAEMTKQASQNTTCGDLATGSYLRPGKGLSVLTGSWMRRGRLLLIVGTHGRHDAPFDTSLSKGSVSATNCNSRAESSAPEKMR